MQPKHVYICCLTLVSPLWASQVMAQEPLSTAFTYQGVLKQAGEGVDGPVDFQFGLWRHATSTDPGDLVCAPNYCNGVDVSEGRFTVELDFGVENLNGDAFWLEITVAYPAGSGDWTTLVPRQPLRAAPYALQTRGLFVDAGLKVGIGTTNPIGMLEIENTESVHGVRATVPYVALHGHRTGTSGTWPAVHGECDSQSDEASGVRGVITSTDPGWLSAGVYGINHGLTFFDGFGVRGEHDGGGSGVYGHAPSGSGVAGYSENGNGTSGVSDTGNGLWGTSTTGIGVRGAGGSAGGYFYNSDEAGHTPFAYLGYIDAEDEEYGAYAGGRDAGGYFYVMSGATDTSVRLAYQHATCWGVWVDGDNGGWFHALPYGTTAYVAAGSESFGGNGSKSFVQNHPEDKDKVIVYTCLEGDEVATYTRGTARLVDGEARVPLGETFKWVTNPDIGLTAHLTPREQPVPLAVVLLTTDELVVRGPNDGPDDVVFDYLVHGLRIGFEQVSVVREKTHEAYIPSMADHRELYERDPGLRRYNALERFRAMQTAIGRDAPLDLSASETLRDAVVECDPAVPACNVDRRQGRPGVARLDEGEPTTKRPTSPNALDSVKAEIAELRARLAALEAHVAALTAAGMGDE